jgi:polar amino acid transport system substrate-binding protein
VRRSSPTVRSLLLGTCLVVAGAGGVAAQSQSPGAPSFGPLPSLPAITSLLTPGTLSDCVDIEYSPMEYFPTADVTDPSQAIGFDVDGARAVAAALGLTLEIHSTDFAALIPDLQAGRCDIVWTALYINEDRLAVADAVPYMATGQVVMVPAGNPTGIHVPEDLCGRTVSIQAGGLVETRINEQSTACTTAGKAAINIQGYPKVADEFQQIILGRVDAVWETDSAVSDWMIRNPGLYEVAYALPKDDSYGIYFGKGKTDVGTALSAALLALKGNGQLAAIAARYQIDPITLDVIK